MLEDWTLRLRSLFKRNAVERELDDELRFHFEQQVASYTRQGLPYEEAARRARLALGTVDRIKEEHRDVRGVRLVDDLHRDVSFGTRQLRRSPGFALAAIFCLALGIGATTTIVTVVNTILLQPLPFADSDGLVRVIENFPLTAPGRRVMQRGITYQEFLDWQRRARTLSDAIAVAGMGQRLVRTSQGAAGLWGATISANAFAVLGAAAVTRFLQGMLFGITPLDRRTFLAVALTFGFVTMLASYVPARRATRVDPLVALRSE
jgi:hypothetical protein